MGVEGAVVQQLSSLVSQYSVALVHQFCSFFCSDNMAQSVSNGVHVAAKRSRRELSGGGGGRWVVRCTRQAQDCVNPVRSCEEKYFREAMASRDQSKELIKLSIGEWTR